MRQLNTLGGDNLYMDFRVYVEGVQIPFSMAQVNNTYGQFPQASVTVAPWRGLSEITKGYFPKIQIFARDPNQGLATYDRLEEANQGQFGNGLTQERHAYKVIFDGVITSVTDSKSVSAGGASASVTLNCQHPFYTLYEILVRYATTDQVESAKTTSYGILDINIMNTKAMMMLALSGIKQPADGQVTLEDGGLDPQILSSTMASNADRLQGMPGVLVVLWNLIKQQVYQYGKVVDRSAMKDMYIPLMEEGVSFFNSLTGHPVLETMIQGSEGIIDGTLKEGEDKSGTVANGTPSQINTTGSKLPLPVALVGWANALHAQFLNIVSSETLLNGSGDITSYGELFKKFIDLIEYDHLIMNSPAIIGVNGRTEFIEHVIKPQLTCYYSPICNVMLPNMYTSASFSVDSSNAPSRVVLQGDLFKTDELNNHSASVNGLNEIGPHSVRYATAGGPEGKLVDSLQSHRLAVGKYEWGSGIRMVSGQLPYWYSVLSASDFAMEESSSARVTALKNSWNGLFPGIPQYNMWESAEVNGMQPVQRIFLARADQEYVKAVAGSRRGMIQGVFNPYIVVGYPGDVIDPSPLRASYHGLVTSVSHTFSSEGYAETSVGMANCLTYDELATCYLPPTYPWLLEPLNLQDNPSIWNNEPAWQAANRFYSDVLGVGAANPSALVSSFTGLPMPVVRNGGVWQLGGVEAPKDVQQTLYTSTLGNLNLVARNIASLHDIEARYCKGSESFIDIDMWNQGEITLERMQKGPWVQDVERPSTMKRGRDIESSAFLDYDSEPEAPVKESPPASPGKPIPALQKAEAWVTDKVIQTRAEIDPNALPPMTNRRCTLGGLDADSLKKLKTCDERLIRVVKEVCKDIPIIVNSGHRPPEHNAKVGGKSGSRHLKYPSWAVDMQPCGLTGSAFDASNKTKMKQFADHVLKVGAALGVKLRWGGTFSGYYDPVHFDLGLG